MKFGFLLCGYFLTNEINKQNKNICFGAIHAEKLRKYIIKDFTNIGMELVCNFQNWFIIGSNMSQNGLGKGNIKMIGIKQLLQTCIVFSCQDQLIISLNEANELLKKHCEFGWTMKGFLLTPRNQPKNDDYFFIDQFKVVMLNI